MEAERDQALAKLYKDSGWTDREIAKKEGKSQTWVHFRILLGEFLITSGSQTLPSDFTERRFRAYWSRTDQDDNEADRFDGDCSSQGQIDKRMRFGRFLCSSGIQTLPRFGRFLRTPCSQGSPKDLTEGGFLVTTGYQTPAHNLWANNAGAAQRRAGRDLAEARR
jgi:hypothetical protein